MKADIRPWRDRFAQRSIVLLFEKPSLRTRVSFEVGFARMGGHAVYLDHERQRIGQRESVADYGRNLERWCDCIVARTMEQRTIESLAARTSIPVINALSDLHHPCQALADFMTLAELGFDFSRDQLAWIGDGNNVCHSLIELAATLGTSMVICTPEGFEPSPAIMRDAEARACRSGASLRYTHDPRGIQGSFAVYTDAWISMGAEPDPQEAARIRRVFAPYRVTAEAMAVAGPNAFFMHCLPAHRGEEVLDDVIDDPRSVVFDQAENRLHMQNALLLSLLSSPAPARRRAAAELLPTWSHA
jgi:ornithine carbamoyltransferase